MAAQNKLRTQMAQQFLDALQQDQLPWKACWQQTRPQNAVNGKLYRGVNALYLSYVANERDYKDPRWCTYNQAQEQGWQVQKGAKAARVEYWAYYDLKQKKLLSWSEAKDLLSAEPDYLENLQLRSRVYPVFNGQQIDGIPAWEQSQGNTDIGVLRQQRDTLISNMGIGYEEHGQRAYYSPGFDTVTLPPEASFDDTYSYIATFLHECGHATGHHTRLDRDLSGGKGSPEYAREELRAEIASAFTAQALGLQLTDEQLQTHMDQHIAYVQSWIEVLQKSPDELFRAIKAAEQISDYLMEKGEFEIAISREATSGKSTELTLVAIESTDDYTGPGFSTDLVDIDVQNEDGTYGRIQEQFRIVTIGQEGFLRSVDNQTYQSFDAAVEAVAQKPQYALVSYDDIVHKAMDLRMAARADAHQKYLKEAADRGRYMTGNGEVLPHPTSILVPPSMLLELTPKYPWASREQLDEIAAGILDDLSPEQIAIFAQPEYSALQMNSLRYAIQGSLSIEQLMLLSNPAFDSVQMDVLRACFQSGMTMEQLTDFAKPEVPAQRMLDAYWSTMQSQEHLLPETLSVDLEP